MKRFEEGLKQLRSSEMLALREMENPDFSFTQKCSNDHVPSQSSASPFIKELEYIKYPNGYSTH